MGFYSGTSTGPNDLIDKLRIALLAESWTVDDFSAVGAGYRLHVHKTASDSTVMYFNFRSAIAETGTTLITEDNAGDTNGTVTAGLIINGSTGYDGGELWHKQPGYPQNVNNSNKSFGNVMSPMSLTAIPAYYFFFNGDSVHIIVEITSGKFQFMSFGMIVKQGTITGGQFFTASLGSHSPYLDYNGPLNHDSSRYFVNNPYIALDVDGAVYLNVDSLASWRNAGVRSSNPQIIFPCPGPGVISENFSKSGMASFFWSTSPDAYNAMAAMCPIDIFLRRSDANYSLIGRPEGVRFLNVANYEPAEEIAYGDETWKVFHANGVAGTPQNMYTGFAFLKVV
jgi:hypothetical protein